MFSQLTKHKTPKLPTECVVRNLSSRTLTPNEEEVLALGLNFATTPRQVPVLRMIASTEATASKLGDEAAQLLRLRVSSILCAARPPNPNLSHGLQTALGKLQRDKDVIIVPADKGNSTVIMDRSDYTKKMEELLKNDTYDKLKKDPTN